jgi:hypothetical protein
MNYDPFSREQISSGFFFKFSIYGLHLQVLITAAADEPVYREYRYTRDIQIACLQTLLVMLLTSVLRLYLPFQTKDGPVKAQWKDILDITL